MDKLVKILEKLKQEIDRYNVIKKESAELKQSLVGNKEKSRLEELNKESSTITTEVTYLLKKIKKISNINDYYFSDCTQKTYLKTLYNRFEDYKKNNTKNIPDLHDFIQDEYRYLFNEDKRHFIKYDTLNIDYSDFWKKIFEFSVYERQKKDIIKSYNWKIEDSENDFYLSKEGLLIEISKSEVIVEKICHLIEVHEKQKKDFVDLEEAIHSDDFNNEDYLYAEQELSELESRISQKLDELYVQSQKDDYYYPDCTFDIFKKKLDDDFKSFITQNPDSNKTTFLKSKLHSQLNIDNYRTFYNNGKYYEYGKYIIETLKYVSSFNKKINFLTDSIKSNGYIPKIKRENNKFFITLEDKNEIDSNTKEQKKNITVTDNKHVKKDEDVNKIEWIAGPATLGFILGHLDSLGYLETPKRGNGDTNYSAFARQVLKTFEIKSTEDTLKKYLNIDSEKARQISNKFRNQNFCIPHKKSISE